MAFDGALLYKVSLEIKEAIDCHIDKIYQPSRDELVLLLRKKGFVKRLLISSKPGSSRIHFTEEKYENPASPPMFCMLIRKHLSSARLINVLQPSLERVLTLEFSATNEMGDRVSLNLICELIGNQSNIILANSDLKIIDCLKRSDIETCVRLLQPGAVYEYPISRNKLNPLDVTFDFILQNIYEKKESLVSTAILNSLDGFSPLICREIAFNSSAEDLLVKDINLHGVFSDSLKSVFNDLADNTNPVMVLNTDSQPMDFTFTTINQYGNGYKNEKYPGFSELLDGFYSKREATARINSAASDITKLVNSLLSRTKRKLTIREEELKQCGDREQLRIYGELLKANLYAINPGSSFAEVENYYDENLSLVKIPLDPALSPANNAAKYFKDYKKSNTAKQTLEILTKNDIKEIAYFESVLDSIKRAENITTISEIRDELSEEKYIRKPKIVQKKKAPVEFKEFTSIEGYKIIVGRNNRQNDYLTTVLASKNDLWFHTKNIPGSHVIILSGGSPVSDETILQAAALAAENSKASDSSNVPVDYTPVKNVKKPNGAKPGMVIYTTNQTVFVTPKE